MSFEITGKTIERELFGHPERERRSPEYLKYREAMEVVRKLQPGDPKDPKSDFAYEVMNQIEHLLDITNKAQLSFFTAVDSLLDYKHGVDGWFELEGGQRVTIDLTTNPEKMMHKADIVFTVPTGGLDRSLDQEQFVSFARLLAREAAERLSGGEVLT